MKLSKIVLIVLLLLAIPISASTSGYDYLYILEDDYVGVLEDNSVDIFFKQCKFMNKLVLDSIRLSKPDGNLSDPQDRLEDKLDAIGYAIKADIYKDIYINACGPEQTRIYRELMDEVIKQELIGE
jgi:hypothetical protein